MEPPDKGALEKGGMRLQVEAPKGAGAVMVVEGGGHRGGVGVSLEHEGGTQSVGRNGQGQSG